MKRLFFILSLPVLLFLVSPSFAADEDDKKIEIVTVDVEGDFVSMSKEEQQALLERLTEGAEKASEGAAPPEKSESKITAFFKEYAIKLNIPRAIRGMLRWYYVQETEFPSFAADISVMLLASHSSEMLSGFVVPPIMDFFGASDASQWVMRGLGGIISVPGWDPLCGLFIWAYVKKPRFRNGVTQTRLVVMKGLNILGVDRFLNWFVQKQSRIDFIQNAIQSDPGRYTYMIQPEDGVPGLNYAFQNSKGEVFTRLEFARDPNRGTVALKTVRFEPEAANLVSVGEFARMLGLFNLNVSMALSQAFKALKKNQFRSLGHEFHVESMSSDLTTKTLTIQFIPRALKLTDRRSWSDPLLKMFGCTSDLEGHRWLTIARGRW